MNELTIPRTPSAHEAPLLIGQILEHGVAAAPEQEIVYGERLRYTYATLAERVRRLASALSALGVPRPARLRGRDLGPVLAGFAALLAEGGVLCVADLEAEDGSFHGDGFEGHHGFDRAALRSQVLAAGFDDVEFEACGTVARPSGVFRMFLMTARRAARG